MAARARGGSGALAVVLAVLVLAVLGIGWMVWSGRVPTTPPAEELDLDLKLPATPNLPDSAPMPDPQPAPVPVPTPRPG